jgi:hypothetical protein
VLHARPALANGRAAERGQQSVFPLINAALLWEGVLSFGTVVAAVFFAHISVFAEAIDGSYGRFDAAVLPDGLYIRENFSLMDHPSGRTSP